MVVEKVEKTFWFCASYFKDSAFPAVKRDAVFLNGYVKGVPFLTRRYTERVPFLSKMVHKSVRG